MPCQTYTDSRPVFPLFGDPLFEALGTDWGIGMLAFLTLGLGGPFLPLVCFPAEQWP